MAISALLFTSANRTQMTGNAIQQLQFSGYCNLNHRIILIEMDLRRSVVKPPAQNKRSEQVAQSFYPAGS